MQARRLRRWKPKINLIKQTKNSLQENLSRKSKRKIEQESGSLKVPLSKTPAMTILGISVKPSTISRRWRK
jgi:hypothetical protein